MTCEYQLHYHDPALIPTALFILWMSRGINSTTRRQKDLPNISRGAVEHAHTTVGTSSLSVPSCTRPPTSTSLVASIYCEPAELETWYPYRRLLAVMVRFRLDETNSKLSPVFAETSMNAAPFDEAKVSPSLWATARHGLLSL